MAEGALWLRRREAGGTAVANSAARVGRRVRPEATPPGRCPPGLQRAGADPPESNAAAFVATAGAYTLDLVALAQGGTCTTAVPDFGGNQGGAMGHVLVGTR